MHRILNSMIIFVLGGILSAGEVRVADGRGMAVTMGFDGSAALPVRVIAPGHFGVDVRERNWFMLRVEGASTAMVTIDLEGVNTGSWSSVNPVIMAGDESRLADRAAFADLASGTSAMVKAANGARVPMPGPAQGWDWITDTSFQPSASTPFLMKPWENVLRLSHRLPASRAVIAMRCPYTSGLDQSQRRRFMDLARQRPDFLRIHDLGQSTDGRSLWVAEFGTGGATAATQRPGLVIYAREHGSEIDAGWTALGAAEFLSTPAARALLDKATVFVIPLLDHDAAAAGIYQGRVIYGFSHEPTVESKAYARFFHEWVERGGRIVQVVNIHNIEGGQSQWHAFPVIQAFGDDRIRAQQWLIDRFKFVMRAQGMGVKKDVIGDHVVGDRLSGWLAMRYGAQQIAFEMNCQAKDRHLTVADLRSAGALLAQTAIAAISDPVFDPVHSAIGAHLATRRRLVERYQPIREWLFAGSAISFEQNLWRTPELEMRHKHIDDIPAWLMPVYRGGRASANDIPVLSP